MPRTNTTKPNAATTTDNVHEFKRTPIDDALDGFTRAQDELLAAINVPSKKRIIAAALSGLVSYAATYYGGASIINTLMLGTVLLTGSAFLTFIIGFVGYMLAFITAVLAGIKVFSFVATMNVSDVKTKIDNAKHRVVRFFKRDNSVDEVQHA